MHIYNILPTLISGVQKFNYKIQGCLSRLSYCKVNKKQSSNLGRGTFQLFGFFFSFIPNPADYLFLFI